MEPIFKSQPTAHWLKQFEAHSVPCGPVNTLAEVFRDPQVLHREMVKTVPHPTLGRLPLVGPAVKYSQTPATVRTAPPLLGQHTRLVLREWCDLDDDALDQLQQAGVIAQNGM